MHRNLLASAVVLALALAACGNDEVTPTAPPKPRDERPRAKASVAHGGSLYDTFWLVSEAREPSSTHPLWDQRPDKASNKRTGSTTWRCKECHGWDYKGAAGAYATGSHATGFGGVFGTQLDAGEIQASLADAHGYRAAGLSDLDLESLALFVTQGLVDTDAYIDGTSFRGDAERGKRLYMQGLGGNKSCKLCHGARGLKVPDGTPPSYDDYVGKVASENPWEFLHKVRFGQPGAVMPAAHGTSATMQDIADLGAFAQTLPTSK